MIAGLLALAVVVLTGPGAAGSVDLALLMTGHGSFGATGVAFSPDGTVLASGYANGTVRLWDVATGQVHGPVLQAGSGPTGGVTGVAFSPDGNLVASADADGAIRLWDPVTGQPADSPLQASSRVNAVAFGP